MDDEGKDFAGYMDNLAAADAEVKHHQDILDAHEVRELGLIFKKEKAHIYGNISHISFYTSFEIPSFSF